MMITKSRQWKQSLKASALALYMIANIAGLMAMTMDYSPQDEITSHLCIGHLSLMTDVTPDIHC